MKKQRRMMKTKEGSFTEKTEYKVEERLIWKHTENQEVRKEAWEVIAEGVFEHTAVDMLNAYCD